jgi:hypothetical protein
MWPSCKEWRSSNFTSRRASEHPDRFWELVGACGAFVGLIVAVTHFKHLYDLAVYLGVYLLGKTAARRQRFLELNN